MATSAVLAAEMLEDWVMILAAVLAMLACLASVYYSAVWWVG